MTGAEAARRLGVDPAVVTRRARTGTLIPAARTAGGHCRWDLDDLRRQLEGQERPDDVS